MFQAVMEITCSSVPLGFARGTRAFSKEPNEERAMSRVWIRDTANTLDSPPKEQRALFQAETDLVADSGTALAFRDMD